MYINNLYYKRGLYFIDKMLNAYTNDINFYQNRLSFFDKEFFRFVNNRELTAKDTNAFFISSVIALLGLKKEKIENLGKHENYEAYDFSKNNPQLAELVRQSKKYPGFDEIRVIPTPYDLWLSITNCDYPSLNYLMNIRNGLLHSEYKVLDDYGFALEVNNSNYTHFQGTVVLNGFIAFACFYFGNNHWSGLIENFNLYGFEDVKLSLNKEELKENLSSLVIKNISYNKKDEDTTKRIPDYEIAKKINLELKDSDLDIDLEKILNETLGDSYDYNVTTTNLTSEQINTIVKMVEKYYGDEFYNFSLKDQIFQLNLLTRYLVDSKSVISEWIVDHITTLNTLRESAVEFSYEQALKVFKSGEEQEYNERSVFASRTAILVVKLYHVLYRMQYKEYEDVDYTKVDLDLSIDDYSYKRTNMDGTVITDFSEDVLKLQEKHDCDVPTLQRMAVCEIIRNSLAHGNFEIEFKDHNGELTEYFVFSDEYHHKTRRLEMSMDKIEKLLSSEAFSSKESIYKEKPKVKSLK